MDVHDTDEMSRQIPLQPGMVITVEPGKMEANFVQVKVKGQVYLDEVGSIVLMSGVEIPVVCVMGGRLLWSS